jgi:hypothetical protein
LIPRSLCVILSKQPETFINRRKHPEREAVDLQNAEGVDVVFVPFDERAVGHRAVFEGDDLAQWRFGDHEAADVLREMAREAEELLDQADDHPDRAVARV